MNTRTLGSEAGYGPRAKVRQVPFDAPWEWLRRGWQDLWAEPRIGLSYGAVAAFMSLTFIWGLTHVGWQSAILVLCGGFLIVAPMFAVGLYEVSRRRQAGEPVTASNAFFAKAKSPGQLAFMGFILLFLFGAWLRIAFMLFAIFFGSSDLPAIENFVPSLLFTAHGLSMLVFGTIVGGGLALVAYVISVVSIPMLTAERTDVYTAIETGVRAVATNPRPMLLWAALIAAFTACGIATLMLGLIVVFPLLGHATWHAYRAVVEIERKGHE
ncbi:MAG: DUF2189 domain-containing protein [Rhizobiales bacterium]|nr:DUF2189 domain-containing protein [Hyphomicrobiales bacterium]